MSDTAVTTTNVKHLAENTVATAPAGQAVTTGNTAVLTPQAGAHRFTGSSSLGSQFTGRYLLIDMLESGSTTSTATFKAGVTGGTPANLAATGDLAAITLTTGQHRVIKLDLARFQQTNGTIRCDITGSGASVTFVVYEIA